jgi:type IV fimbrial biogenesis protein FimT
MKKNIGFTLVELLVVLAIAGFLAMAAAPSMRTYISNSLSNSISSSLLIDIMYARNHAISNETTVTMRPNDATLGSGALVIPGNGVNWGLGWQISEQVNGNARIIRQHVSFGPDAQIRSTDALNTLDQLRPIIFNASGVALNPGMLSVGTTGCAGDNARTIQINQIGQVIGNDIQCHITLTNN